MELYSAFQLVMVLCSDWGKVEEDCRRAIQLDHNSVKVRISLLHCLFGFLFYNFELWNFSLILKNLHMRSMSSDQPMVCSRFLVDLSSNMLECPASQRL